jgi:hypothetical protein
MKSHYASSYLKPAITDAHKLERLRWVLNLQHGRTHRFQDQFDRVVIDESWFYLHEDQMKVRVIPGGDQPTVIRVQHKKHIPKIMFLCALARPRPEHGFDGKIGIFRVCKEKEAQRNSKYHVRGEVYVEDVNMNSELYVEMMSRIIDEIKLKMPWMRNTHLYIQQDGAGPHRGHDAMARLDAIGTSGGWHITMITQPAKSPDLNINDLSFFRSLKCRVEEVKIGAENLDDLYNAVLTSWNDYDMETLQILWGHQYACYRCIIEKLGDNDYTNPHTGVRKMVGHMDLNIEMVKFREAKRWIQGR